MKTQVAIIGGGPSGLLLGQLLHVQGIDAVVLERRTKAHVLKRIRAGVLERGLIDLLAQAQVPTRMETDGYAHDGTVISYDAESFRIDFAEHTGSSVMVYGQTEVTHDLYDALDAAGVPVVHEAEDVRPQGLETSEPFVTYRTKEQGEKRIDCDFVAVVRFQGPKSNGMPELHKLTPLLGVLQDRGHKVALVTDGRMSGASGKVPAAIHVTPEAKSGGPIAKVMDGDMIRVDGETGTLEVLVDDATLNARTPEMPDLSGNEFGMGRELFAAFRSAVGDAETGASVF